MRDVGTLVAGPGRASLEAQVVASLCRKAKPVSELLPKARISVAAVRRRAPREDDCA